MGAARRPGVSLHRGVVVLRYVGQRAGNAVNDFDLPSYTVADAFATYYTSAASRFFVSIGDSRQVTLSSTLEF